MMYACTYFVVINLGPFYSTIWKLLKIINLLRSMVAYMRQGNKYFTVRKQIIITLPAFTL